MPSNNCFVSVSSSQGDTVNNDPANMRMEDMVEAIARMKANLAAQAMGDVFLYGRSLSEILDGPTRNPCADVGPVGPHDRATAVHGERPDRSPTRADQSRLWELAAAYGMGLDRYRSSNWMHNQRAAASFRFRTAVAKPNLKLAAVIYDEPAGPKRPNSDVYLKDKILELVSNTRGKPIEVAGWVRGEQIGTLS